MDLEVNDIESEGVVGKDMDWNKSDFLDKDMMMRESLLLKKSVNTTSQTAIIGANVCPIESLDYEITENELFKQDWRSRTKVQMFQYAVLKWNLALLIGVATGLVGFFNNLAVENIAGFKLLLTSKLMMEERYYKAFGVLAGCNVVLAATAAAICAYLAPAAAGSGIPEVKAYLNGVDAHSILAPSTLFVKIFGSIFGVAAGFVAGKEGPMVHTGACIASLLGQGGSRKYHLTWTWLRYFKNDRDRRDLITCGAAAGVAAAFRAPMGGVLFALEEVASWWRSALLWRTFFTTAVVAVVLRALIEYCRSGKCGLFGEGGLIMYDVSKALVAYGAPDFVAVIVVGIFGGLLGSLYNHILDKNLRIYSLINERGAHFKILLTVAISLLTSCLSYGLPWFANCTPCPAGLQEQCPTIGRSGNFKSFQCPAGTYNDLASIFLNTSDDAIRNLFSSGTETEFHISSLFLFFVSIYALGIVTYGIAVPSGLFIPVILAGAAYGRLVGTLVGDLMRAGSHLDTGLFALLGAASFLGGTMRMTVSVCVILLELTNDLLMLPLVMLVLLISKMVADRFNIGVYEQILKMKGLPYMRAHAEPFMTNLVARDVVSSPPVSFSGVEKVGNILQALRMTEHNGFPVVDEPPLAQSTELCGLVLRSHLLVLLKARRFSKERVATGREMVRGFDAADFGKGGLGRGLKLEELEITEEEMELFIDLHPITNASPYTVLETMSLAKAAVLFRELGLRHLCVVPKSPMGPPVIGMLTRHDFMREHILNLHPRLRARKWENTGWGAWFASMVLKM